MIGDVVGEFLGGLVGGSYDEYGNVLANVDRTGAVNYGWLGAKERALDSSGKPYAARPFDLAVQTPDVVVWRTVEQEERSPEDWNVGITVAEYVEKGGV